MLSAELDEPAVGALGLVLHRQRNSHCDYNLVLSECAQLDNADQQMWQLLTIAVSDEQPTLDSAREQLKAAVADLKHDGLLFDDGFSKVVEVDGTATRFLLAESHSNQLSESDYSRRWVAEFDIATALVPQHQSILSDVDNYLTMKRQAQALEEVAAAKIQVPQAVAEVEAAAAYEAAKTSTDQRLFKTKLCKSYEIDGFCRYGSKCNFAHGHVELRRTPHLAYQDLRQFDVTRIRSLSTPHSVQQKVDTFERRPFTQTARFKTRLCEKYTLTGHCAYAERCTFAHGRDELRQPPQHQQHISQMFRSSGSVAVSRDLSGVIQCSADTSYATDCTEDASQLATDDCTSAIGSHDETVAEMGTEIEMLSALAAEFVHDDEVRLSISAQQQQEYVSQPINIKMPVTKLPTSPQQKGEDKIANPFGTSFLFDLSNQFSQSARSSFTSAVDESIWSSKVIKKPATVAAVQSVEPTSPIASQASPGKSTSSMPVSPKRSQRDDLASVDNELMEAFSSIVADKKLDAATIRKTVCPLMVCMDRRSRHHQLVQFVFSSDDGDFDAGYKLKQSARLLDALVVCAPSSQVYFMLAVEQLADSQWTDLMIEKHSIRILSHLRSLFDDDSLNTWWSLTLQSGKSKFRESVAELAEDIERTCRQQTF